MSDISAIDIEALLSHVAEPWSPVEVCRLNGQVIRLAKFHGEYHWHTHDEEDELFYVYRGEITIQLRDREDLILREGQLGVVPKGVEHCPKSAGESYVLMFEPAELKSTGDN